jgi:CDP-glycerol glycerophosphotransferase
VQIKAKRKLVLFAPTFRENHTSAIEQITSEEWEAVSIFAKKTNILFGIRPHPYDIKYLPKKIIDNPHFYLFENSSYTEPNILLKHTDVLIVDYSSIWIDYLLLHRPIIGFSKDYVQYLEEERGFVYDFNSIFPNTFTAEINELINTIEISLSINTPTSYHKALNLFHQYPLEYDYAIKIYNEIKIQYNMYDNSKVQIS